MYSAQIVPIYSVREHTVAINENEITFVPRGSKEPTPWAELQEKITTLLTQQQRFLNNREYSFITALRQYEWNQLQQEEKTSVALRDHFRPITNHLSHLPRELKQYIFMYLPEQNQKAIFHIDRAIFMQRRKAVELLTTSSSSIQTSSCQYLNLLPLRCKQEWTVALAKQFPDLKKLKIWLSINWPPSFPNTPAKKALFGVPPPNTPTFCQNSCVERTFFALQPLLQLQKLTDLEIWGIPEEVVSLLLDPIDQSRYALTDAGKELLKAWGAFSKTNICKLIKAKTAAIRPSRLAPSPHKNLTCQGYLSPPTSTMQKMTETSLVSPVLCLQFSKLSVEEQLNCFTKGTAPDGALLSEVIIDFSDVSSEEFKSLSTKMLGTNPISPHIKRLKIINFHGLDHLFFQAIARGAIEQLYVSECSFECDSTSEPCPLAPLTNTSITTLLINDCANITSKQYNTISKIYSLKHLYLEKVQISDEDLQLFQDLIFLRKLSLDGSTAFEGRGLQFLNQLPIQELILSRSSCTHCVLPILDSFLQLRTLQLNEVEWTGFEYDIGLVGNYKSIEELQATGLLDWKTSNTLQTLRPGLRTGYKLFSNE